LARSRPPPLWIALAALTAVLFGAIYLVRLDRVVGLIVDDAWYVLLAKALADGHGYTLINSPTAGIHPFYAPFFPFLLSFFYRLWPEFPADLPLLKGVSIAAMAGVGALVHAYFRRVRGVPAYPALGLAAATVFYPALVFLATSTVMSECVFTLLEVAAILAVERGARRDRGDLRFAALGGLLAAAAVLTRPAGLGLLLGAPLYLAGKRLPRALAAFAAAAALVVGPWMLHSRAHAPTPEQRAEQGSNIVQPYTVQFWQRTAGRPLSGTIGLSDLPGRIANNLYEIANADMGAIVSYPLFRSIEPGDPVEIGRAARCFSLLFAALAVFGYATAVRERLSLAELVTPLALAVSVSWGWEQFRLLLPLVPFLTYYLMLGAAGLAAAARGLRSRESAPLPWAVATMLVAVIVALDLYGNYQYIDRLLDPAPDRQLHWHRAFDANERLIRHLGEALPHDAIIAAGNPALVHLYTGQKTVAAYDPAGSWETWKEIGVRYLAFTSSYRLDNRAAAEAKFRTIYYSGGEFNFRVLDLGDPTMRPSWTD